MLNLFKRLFGKRSNLDVVADQEVDATAGQLVATYEQLAPIIYEIHREVIACLPESWTNAVLIITCRGRSVDYSLRNHTGGDGQASLPPRLERLAEKLFASPPSQGDRWTKAVLRYDKDGDLWQTKSEFG